MSPFFPLRDLHIEALAVSRGGRWVLRNLSFDVAPGEALLITGENGAGKSTLLKTVFGLLEHQAGTIVLGDGKGEDIASSCHYLGHREGVKTALSVRDNVAFWRAFLQGNGLSAHDALEKVGLLPLADLPAAYLSAGQRRRLALARLFVAPRPLWLLDEPTSALDLETQAKLFSWLEEHRRHGGMLLIATHLPIPLAGARNLRLEALHEDAAS